MTKGQQAMAVAMMFPEPAKVGRGKVEKFNHFQIDKGNLSRARAVLANAPKLAAGDCRGARAAHTVRPRGGILSVKLADRLRTGLSAQIHKTQPAGFPRSRRAFLVLRDIGGIRTASVSRFVLGVSIGFKSELAPLSGELDIGVS
jgi:hypothetical protein